MYIPRGLYVHVRTGRRYFVEATARLTENPTKRIVVYRQLYDSCLRNDEGVETFLKLPEGTMWARDIDEFFGKFDRIHEDR